MFRRLNKFDGPIFGGSRGWEVLGVLTGFYGISVILTEHFFENFHVFKFFKVLYVSNFAIKQPFYAKV